jgi:hypothetical protein
VHEVGAELQPSGIAFAIDDFGRGYLPMARLQELPRFSELKLDRGFVAGCAADKGHAAIGKTVIDLAHNFGSEAVAVGVEDPADANALAKMGCDIAQGYLFAQPMAMERFQALLRQRAEQTNAAGRARKPDGDGQSDGPGKARGKELVAAKSWSVCPEAPTCEGEVVGIRHRTARRLLGLEYLVRDAVPLAIGDGFLLGIEEQAQLLLHVA